LRDAGFDGVIGLEAYPQSDDMEAMVQFRRVFS